MEYKWLNKQNNKQLILFFNGWGMNEDAVRHLAFDDTDVLILYDYNSLEVDLSEIKKYSEVNVIAWSMGVMAAGIVLKPIIKEINKITVINGTLKPIDDKYGIPQKIYNLTIQHFSDESAEKFAKNMFENGLSHNFKLRKPMENIKNELVSLQKYADTQEVYEFVPTKIYISKKDKIIPPKHQSAFWGIDTNFEGGHYIFDKFKKWSELL